RRIGINPTDLVLYINSQCNLRCSHCYVGNELLNASVYYSLASILDFIADLPPLDRVTVLGGEPFYHPRLREVVEALGGTPAPSAGSPPTSPFSTNALSRRSARRASAFV